MEIVSINGPRKFNLNFRIMYTMTALGLVMFAKASFCYALGGQIETLHVVNQGSRHGKVNPPPPSTNPNCFKW